MRVVMVTFFRSAVIVVLCILLFARSSGELMTTTESEAMKRTVTQVAKQAAESDEKIFKAVYRMVEESDKLTIQQMNRIERESFERDNTQIEMMKTQSEQVLKLYELIDERGGFR